MKISDIIKSDEYIYSDISDDTEFSKITSIPTEVEDDGILFVPNSVKFRYNDAMPRPLAIVCDTSLDLPQKINTIRVSNARLALANAFYRYYDPIGEDMTVVGITGTNGKSSTLRFVEEILMCSGIKVGSIGTGRVAISKELISDQYYSMTTPDPEYLYKIMRKMRDEGCKVIVMEVSSHALALEKVAPIKFNYALFTNLSSEHLDFHGSTEEYFTAKMKLFKNCEKAVINLDDSYGRRLASTLECQKITAGILWRGDVYAHNIENHGLSGVSYYYHANDILFKAELSVCGAYNIYNSMLAAAVCIDMGIKPCDVKRYLSGLKKIEGRYDVIKDKISVVIDYAHTHQAFYNIMKELQEIKQNSMLTVVFGCGGERDREKRPKMAEAAEKYADKIIITQDNSRNENPKDIIADIIRGIKSKGYEIEENREKAIRRAILSANDGDIVAIIGKGAEKYNIDSLGYHDFDEKSIILSALKDRREAKRQCE